MSKLLKLLEWVSVPKAAKYLSAIFEEEVTEADVFHLALEKRLTLSVNFVNGVEARKCKLLPLSEARLEDGIPVPGREQYKVPLRLAMPDGKHVLDVEREVVPVSGVWDLPMIGDEVSDVGDRYHQLTGGPRVTGHFLDGVFIQRAEDLYQLQYHLEQSDRFTKADLSEPWANAANFVPAAGLPDDVAFVVRVAEVDRWRMESRRVAVEVGAQVAEPETPLQPVQRHEAHCAAILAALRTLGRDPQGLPPFKNGKACPVKAEVRRACGNLTDPMFDKAWKSLTGSGAIARAR